MWNLRAQNTHLLVVLYPDRLHGHATQTLTLTAARVLLFLRATQKSIYGNGNVFRHNTAKSLPPNMLSGLKHQLETHLLNVACSIWQLLSF